MTEPMKYKMCIVVRDDLGMSSGKLAVQVAHACCGIAMDDNAWPDKGVTCELDSWFDEGQRKIVLRVPDLEALLKVQAKAIEHKLPNYLVTDRGLTELEAGTVTALGVGPATNEEMKPVTGWLKLL